MSTLTWNRRTNKLCDRDGLETWSLCYCAHHRCFLFGHLMRLKARGQLRMHASWRPYTPPTADRTASQQHPLSYRQILTEFETALSAQAPATPSPSDENKLFSTLKICDVMKNQQKHNHDRVQNMQHHTGRWHKPFHIIHQTHMFPQIKLEG
jgi:hypothetical protein